jgi:hypothetical protein
MEDLSPACGHRGNEHTQAYARNLLPHPTRLSKDSDGTKRCTIAAAVALLAG